MRIVKLDPNDRLLIEYRPNRYKVIGPGHVVIWPWHAVLARLYVGVRGHDFLLKAIRTVENVPLDIHIKTLYLIDPELFTDGLLPKVPILNEKGWVSVLEWRLEHISRSLIATYSWREISKQKVQEQLERLLTQTLAGYMANIGMKVSGVFLIKIELPTDLQNTILQTERDGIEPRGRALVLKEYFEIFGTDLPQVMPYIVQWETLNVLHKNGKAQFLLTHSGLTSAPNGHFSGNGSAQPLLQMPLPFYPEESEMVE